MQEQSGTVKQMIVLLLRIDTVNGMSKTPQKSSTNDGAPQSFQLPKLHNMLHKIAQQD
jgi:hypothetical protein